MSRIPGLLSFLFMMLVCAAAARAQIHFAAPVPAFEQALATAKLAGKPLVVEFSATWCSPCKLMARDFSRPKAQPTLELVHLVVYDGSDEEVGSALMAKLGANGFPTLVAFDSAGKEVGRTKGYSRWADTESWLKALPEKAIPLEQILKSAAAAPKDIKLQLNAAQRLAAVERYSEARTYYNKVRMSTESELAAAASWALLQLGTLDQERKTAQLESEQLAAQYPGTKEAGYALRFLASLPTPPAVLLDRLIVKHLSKLTEPQKIDSLIFVAMKGGAFQAAKQAAAKLEPLAKDSSQYLNTLAEVAFHVEGDSAKAVQIGQRAIQAAEGLAKATYTANVERFRRNQKELADELANFRPPRVTPEAPTYRAPSRRPLIAPMVSALNRIIRDGCWQLAGNQGESIKILVVPAAKPSAHRALFPAGTPLAWSTCALKLIQTANLPEGEIISLRPDLAPPSLAEQIDGAKAAAEDGCTAQAAAIRTLTMALTGEAGKPVSLVFATGPAASAEPGAKPASPELRTCVEKFFSTLKPPCAVLQTVSLRFGED